MFASIEGDASSKARMPQKKVRKNILNLSKEETDKLIFAWKCIQEKPADCQDGFFAIAGYHGQPFRGAGYGNAMWWGGYCHHGNVLFPTWHRAYILRLEEALQKIDADVALPYWDQMNGEYGEKEERIIPKIFTDKKYKFSAAFGGHTIDNPLYSYKFVKGFKDRISRSGVDYGKPEGYKTVRYPYSGLVGSSDERRTNVHNEWMNRFSDDEITDLLNLNLRNWFHDRIHQTASQGRAMGLREKYKMSLEAPNYTVFSNTTSAAQWNDDNSTSGALVVSVESPHNGAHLAVGGYDVPDRPSFDGANGDMGENDTAAFDPVFWFHHCFIDRVFWKWQIQHINAKGHDTVDGVNIIPEYPGTSPVDYQGPTPGIAAHEWLTIDTPLYPFKIPENDWSGRGGQYWTSREISHLDLLPYRYDKPDLTPRKTQSDSGIESDDTENSLGSGEFAYDLNPPQLRYPRRQNTYLRISGIDRSTISGSFIISAWAKERNKPDIFLGCEPIFSRWNVSGCANCNNHLKITAHIPLGGFRNDFLGRVGFRSKIGTSDSRSGFEVSGGQFTTAFVITGGGQPLEGQVEVRNRKRPRGYPDSCGLNS
ncbi:hypothetical protein TWF225_002823 [Orbilia oligospora]|nr:hypothetical protein TWF225_002823 [Orbilia oligospora]KAF3249391.1 hypothetical protein TWF128_007822 [Orbilia oligospora]KAF3249393.1 hypothetical protein TWF128_007822 [Orbilia oligospora]KAF3263814.1 hypothetical protein TWF217_003521 [Orbilia oligospora]